MEQNTTSTKTLILKNGAILGLISILLAVILYVTDNLLEQNWITGIIGVLIMTAIIIYTLNSFKKSNDGYMSLRQALKIGVGVVLIGSLIVGIYNIIFTTFIEPDFTEQVIAQQRETIVESNPNMSNEQIDQAMAITRKFAQPWISFALTILYNIVIGFIITLICGLAMRKNNPYQA